MMPVNYRVWWDVPMLMLIYRPLEHSRVLLSCVPPFYGRMN
jgi:hypothetical protein